jgi:hypothetical protein
MQSSCGSKDMEWRKLRVPRKNLEATNMHEMTSGLMFSRFVSCIPRSTLVMLSQASKHRWIAWYQGPWASSSPDGGKASLWYSDTIALQHVSE